MRILLFILISFISLSTSLGSGLDSTSFADSLENILAKSEGRQKVKILNELYKFYRNKDPKRALRYTESALELAEEINDQKGRAASLNNVGVFYRNTGNYDKALEYFIIALKIEESIDHKEGMVNALSNIGNIYSLKGNYERALQHFEESLKIIRQLDNKRMLYMIYNNIGNIYNEQKEYGKALEMYEQTLKIYNAADSKQTFDPYVNIGNLYFNKGELKKALHYYNLSLETERIHENKIGEANSVYNIGTAYKKLRNYELALNYFEQAKVLANETGDKGLLLKVYLGLSETHLQLQNLFLAYSYLVDHTNLRELIHNEESNIKIAELETAFELSKKEKEIEFLKKESELKSIAIVKNQIILTSIIIAALIILALALIIYRKNQLNQKAKLLLENTNKIISLRKEEIEEQKKIIEEKNQSITDSIIYAKGMQDALLNKALINGTFNDSFVFHKPKDIISGDFHWQNQEGNIIVVCDCTGHGVAGAFMTVVGHSILDNIVHNERIVDPSRILSSLDEKVREILSQQEIRSSSYGMDAAVIKIDHKNNRIIFAGARRPIYIIKNGELTEIKGDKATIGESFQFAPPVFTEHIIDIQKGDVVYAFSDGYADQFGEQQNKKYMSKKFKDLLLKIHGFPMLSQLNSIEEELKKWMGNNEQTDDILVLGFRI